MDEYEADRQKLIHQLSTPELSVTEFLLLKVKIGCMSST